jgi:hypothetical protein
MGETPKAIAAPPTRADDEFYIVDLRPEWQRPKRYPYVTVWRPNDCGYAYPLAWAGIYSKARIDAKPSYYANAKGTGTAMNFPVPRAVVESLAIPRPRPGVVDGDAGPVLPNTAEIRRALRRARYRPERPSARAATDAAGNA